MSRHFGIGNETSYGTAAAIDDFAEMVNDTLQMVREYEDVTTVASNSVKTINLLNEHVEGDVEFIGNYQDIGLLLKGFFGAVTSAGAGPTTHTFPGTSGTSGRSGLSYTVEVRRDNDALTTRYAGMKVVGFSITASSESSPRITFSFIGKSEDRGSATTFTAPTFDPMLTTDITVTVGSSVNATSFTMNAAWPVDLPFKLGSAAFASEPLDNGPLAVEFQWTELITDATTLDLYDGTTENDCSVAITDGTHSLTINMDKVIITSAGANLDGRNRLVANFTGRSEFNTTATENIQVVLRNDDTAIP